MAMIEKEHRERETEKDTERDGVDAVGGATSELMREDDSTSSTVDQNEDENTSVESRRCDAAVAAAVGEAASSLVTYAIFHAVQHICASHAHVRRHGSGSGSDDELSSLKPSNEMHTPSPLPPSSTPIQGVYGQMLPVADEADGLCNSSHSTSYASDQRDFLHCAEMLAIYDTRKDDGMGENDISKKGDDGDDILRQDKVEVLEQVGETVSHLITLIENRVIYEHLRIQEIAFKFITCVTHSAYLTVVNQTVQQMKDKRLNIENISCKVIGRFWRRKLMLLKILRNRTRSERISEVALSFHRGRLLLIVHQCYKHWCTYIRMCIYAKKLHSSTTLLLCKRCLTLWGQIVQRKVEDRKWRSAELLQRNIEEKIYRSSKIMKIFLRMWTFKHRRKKRIAITRITASFRVYLDVKLTRKLRAKQRRIDENTESVKSLRMYRIRQRCFRLISKCCSVAAGLRTMGATRFRHLCRKAVKKWLNVHLEEKVRETFSVTALQSALRKYMVKKYVLDFYGVRRALCRFQAIVRRRRAVVCFTEVRSQFRSARTVQRVVRGYNVRVDLTRRRTEDIRYVAERGNYRKLLYYTTHYSSLVRTLDTTGNSALHYAAKGAAKRTLKLLVRFGLNITAFNDEGFTPLHTIITSPALERDECCTYMLQRGFDDTVRTQDGRTCLLLAVEYNRLVLAKTLLTLGEDPNSRDFNGCTPLQHACWNGSLPSVEVLIEYNAVVNLYGSSGRTPLHYSCCHECERVDIVRTLLDSGADVNAVDTLTGDTAVMMAAKVGGFQLSVQCVPC